ncbi:mRNA splicing factor rna helicase [Colletotrichum higginsianum]|nr:mRNA splicing factor rna helicase [Colletotrichum higginsianum]
MQGKLMEVDLGDEVRARNQAMTEKAARRLLGEVDGAGADNPDGRKGKKPRLGRDGKPWRPRNRRNSDDIKRDQLVEEILRENRPTSNVCNGMLRNSKVDVYDVPKPQEPQNEGPGDADDRIAEEFRREFMDAMVQRQQRKKTAAAPARAGARKADEDVLKGPKLGGSRNSRAAMRDLLLKKEKEKEKDLRR